MKRFVWIIGLICCMTCIIQAKDRVIERPPFLAWSSNSIEVDKIVMSACFALGLDAGTPIKEAALAGGVEGLYAGLPVIFLVTLGGFLTNAVYCLQQNVANKSMGDYAKGKVWGNNLVFCALAGVLWYMQFFGLEMGKSFLTESPVLLAFSWCILMALNVTFSNVWGIILKEWKGVSNKTITVLIAGLIVLIFSLVFPNLF